MPSLIDANRTTAHGDDFPLKLTLKKGWRYFMEEFRQHKFDKLKVIRGENLGVRVGKQGATVLCDGAYLVLHLVKLPVAVAVKGYHVVTHTHAPCYPLNYLEQRTLLQHLADIGVYSVALPFDSAKGLVYLIEGTAKSLGYLGKEIGHLSQQTTHHCCDHEAQVRSPRDAMVHEMAALPNSPQATVMPLNPNSNLPAIEQHDSRNSPSSGLCRG